MANERAKRLVQLCGVDSDSINHSKTTERNAQVTSTSDLRTELSTIKVEKTDKSYDTHSSVTRINSTTTSSCTDKYASSLTSTSPIPNLSVKLEPGQISIINKRYPGLCKSTYVTRSSVKRVDSTKNTLTSPICEYSPPSEDKQEQDEFSDSGDSEFVYDSLSRSSSSSSVCSSVGKTNKYLLSKSGKNVDQRDNSKWFVDESPVKILPKTTSVIIAESPDSTTSPDQRENISQNFVPNNQELCLLTPKKNLHNVTSHRSNNVDENDTVFKRNGKRIYNKRQVCLYCSKPFAKLARHLESSHSNEREVIEFLILDKQSDSRKKLIEVIRKKGNYVYNHTLLKSGIENVIPVRRSKKVSGKYGYLPCEYCLGFYSKSELTKHSKLCSERSTTHKKGTRYQSKSLMLLPFLPSASQNLKEKVFKNMIQDNVFQAIKGDNLILKFGSKLFDKHCHELHLLNFIGTKMRELGRLILKLKELRPDAKELSDFLRPDMYTYVEQAVKEVAGYDYNNNSFKTPSLALKLGISLKQAAQIFKGDCIISNNQEKKEEVCQFLELFQIKWKESISSHALGTLYRQKFNKPASLPLAGDISKINLFLKSALNAAVEKAKTCTKETWLNLCELTLTQVIIFNRRRVGEVERIPLEIYTNHIKGHTMQEEILKSLTDVEAELAKNLIRLEIRGKKGRKVPILLTLLMQQCLEHLYRNRDIGGVSPNNIYLFAKPGTMSYIRGSVTIKLHAIASKCQDPLNITSTKLRKHIATMSQILNLNSNELDQLANFMGHDINVHREYYRLPEHTVQVARISKILLSMEKGDIHKYKGKTINEMNPELSDECFNSDDDTTDLCDTVDLQEDNVNLPSELNNMQNKAPLVIEEKQKKKKESFKTGVGKKSTNGIKRVNWSQGELDAVIKYFQKHIVRKIIPKKDECEICKSQDPVLKERSWKNIKYCVYNMIKKQC